MSSEQRAVERGGAAPKGGRNANPRGQLRVFEFLYELAVTMTADRSLGETLQLVVDRTRDLLGTDTAYIALRDEARGEVVIHTVSGVRTEAFRVLRIPMGAGLGGLVAETRCGYIVEDYFSDENIKRVVDPIVAAEGVVSGVAAPIQMGTKNLGVLFVFNRTKTSFGVDDLDVLCLIANLAAVELSHKGVEDAQRKAQDELEKRVLERTADLADSNARLSREVAERARAEQGLREKTEELDRFFQLSLDLLCIVDSGGTFQRLNPAWEEAFGYRLADLEGKRFLDFVHPDDLAATREAGARLASGRALLDFVNRYRCKDGSYRWIEWRSAPYWNGLIYAAARDITERKKAEEDLNESRRLLQASETVARLGTYVFDILLGAWKSSAVLDGVFGIDERYPRTVEGWLALIHPESQDACRRHLEQALRGPGGFDIEYKVVRPSDGQERWVAGLGEIQRDAAGAPLRMIGTIQDVTERRRSEENRRILEEQLRQAQKMEAVGRLAGGVAHDFNNLLTAILGYCDLLGMKLSPVDPAAKDVGEIRAAGERAAALTHQLLAFSRKQVLQPRVLNLAEVVEDVEKMMRRLLGEDIEISIRAAADTGLIKADPGQIQQVILNLAVNSRDAMPSGGTLTIDTENVECDESFSRRHHAVKPGRYVLLSVSDTGCGMDAAVRARLFEPFFTTKELGKGTGLGLATVHGIVNQSGGHIWVDSEEGQGTTFKIYLPRIDEEGGLASGSQEAGPGPRGTETVLVVEDSEDVRGLVCRILRARGYRVLEASRGEEAIAMGRVEPGTIELMVTDVVMPGMNGRVLAERLAELRPGMKVLFMSGYTEDAIVHHGVLDPDLHFIEKPFRPDDLARKVRQVLNN